MTALKVRRIGNSLGVVIPKEVLNRQGVAEGDTLYLSETAGDMRLAKMDSDFEKKMEAARYVMKKRFAALRELAK